MPTEFSQPARGLAKGREPAVVRRRKAASNQVDDVQSSSELRQTMTRRISLVVRMPMVVSWLDCQRQTWESATEAGQQVVQQGNYAEAERILLMLCRKERSSA